MADVAVQASGITIDDAFRRAFRLYADRPAVTWEKGGWTYGELGQRVERLAGALQGLGLARGDRLAVLSETRPEYVELYAAAARLGVTVVALNIRLHPDELAYCITTATPAVLFSTAMFTATVDTLRRAAGPVREWISLDDGYNDLLAWAPVPTVTDAPS